MCALSGHGKWISRDKKGDQTVLEGEWIDDVQNGPGKVSAPRNAETILELATASEPSSLLVVFDVQTKFVDAELGTVVATGPFVGGQMHGDGCEWRLASGHVYFKGTMEEGRFVSGRMTSLPKKKGQLPVFYEGEFDGQDYSGQLAPSSIGAAV